MEADTSLPLVKNASIDVFNVHIDRCFHHLLFNAREMQTS